jgi:hypothetical protein
MMEGAVFRVSLLASKTISRLEDGFAGCTYA